MIQENVTAAPLPTDKPAKLPYSAPMLYDHGDVAELTFAQDSEPGSNNDSFWNVGPFYAS